MGDNFLFTIGKRIGHRPASLVDTEEVCFAEELETTAHPNPLSQEPSGALSQPVYCLLRGRSSPEFYVISLASQSKVERNGIYLYFYILCVCIL